MQKFVTPIFLSFLLFGASTGQAIAKDFITLNLPEAVIAKAASTILPVNIDAHSKSIEGDITIINISELQLTDNHLACRLHLAGTNLALLTEIAGHEIRLKVGSVEINFKTKAEIRFDRKQQTLFIKPIVEDITASSTASNGDIGQALIALLNGREFPVKMQDLDPLIAETGAKTITINTTIANIAAKPDSIQLSLDPVITAK